MKLHPFGEDALFVDLEDAPSKTTTAFASSLRRRLPGTDIVVGVSSVAIVGTSGWDDLAPLIADALRDAHDGPNEDVREHVVDVVYDGEDLAEIAQKTALSVDRVIALHEGATYDVELLGFMPGFAYLGPLDERLRWPRRASPRPRVSARSVAIAGAQTGIYPIDSPGGWHLLGHAPRLDPFDPMRSPATFAKPGDRVRFRATDDRTRLTRSLQMPQKHRPSLVIEKIVGAASVQDRGRAGRLGDGIPPSGALDHAALASANLAVGNEPGDAALEVLGGGLTIRALDQLMVAASGEPAITLAPGDAFSLSVAPLAVRYLAIGGGLTTPAIFGSRSAFAAIGGERSKVGDLLPVGASRGSSSTAFPSIATSDQVDLFVVPGPHRDRFETRALDVLTDGAYRVSAASDRVGTRFEGAPLPRNASPDRAAPMLRGALQVPPNGLPIALGPDHPVTGGYPIIGVLRRASQAALARLRPGSRVRFRVT